MHFALNTFFNGAICVIFTVLLTGIKADAIASSEAKPSLTFESFLETENKIRENLLIKLERTQWTSKENDLEALEKEYRNTAQNSKLTEYQRADLLQSAMRNKSGNYTDTNWKILFFNDSIMFQRVLGKRTLELLKGKSEKETALDNRTEWLFTPKTYYRKKSRINEILIRELNPQTDRYPFPLDVLHLSLGIFSRQAFENNKNFGFDLAQFENQQAICLPSKENCAVKLLLGETDTGLLPTELLIGKDRVTQKRIYNANMTSDTSLPIALSQFVRYGDQSAELITIREVAFGAVKKEDMEIEGDNTTRISDETEHF